ncbi:ATP-binding protein [Mucilaginibacter robiniae]|uniref:ATP-binding protein n=2 Tax=Mucilaginibacter robiniae TaxID=2728022 RepID=A0A7L5E4Y1_9SPHI|nr:ATP-binding protein [Mucilaginibacter robiniae]
MANANTATQELQWFSTVIAARGAISFNNDKAQPQVASILPPDVSQDASPYAAIIRQFNMGHAERFVLILALVPHLQPELLDILLMKNSATDHPFTQLGGQKGAHGGYLPTGETAVFLLAGNDLQQRYQLLQLFDEEHFFHKHNFLQLQPVNAGEPRLAGLLTPSAEYLALLTTGKAFKPNFTANFPAKRLTTGMEWQDLVVSHHVMAELEELKTWLQHGPALLHDWGFAGKVKPGFRVLFSGPPGTGKTLTAALLGKWAGMDVYRIDLSMVVSKFIGETEKNLANVFDMAENKNWILFFDEADALFGKRTNVGDAHDRHANQEVSYLLQRIEDYNGLIVLATNFKNNVDEAFARRFQVMIDFQKPDEHQRLQLWKNAFTPPCQLAVDVSLPKLAAEYPITGASIMNVLRFCSLRALGRGNTEIILPDIKQAIRKEMHKEGKALF